MTRSTLALLATLILTACPEDPPLSWNDRPEGDDDMTEDGDDTQSLPEDDDDATDSSDDDSTLPLPDDDDDTTEDSDDDSSPSDDDDSTSPPLPGDDDSSPADDDDSTTSSPVDNDGDGFQAGEDCDDSDADIHPGATEACDNSEDDDCDGDVDEGCGDDDDSTEEPTPAPVPDQDGDGSPDADDCDDADPTVYPSAVEICDGQDNNCNGAVLTAGESDDDGDGFMGCEGDCDDSNDDVNPGAAESCNGEDDDCNGSIPVNEQDLDGDTYLACGGDCDDADPGVHPLAIEVCDGEDDDCDGTVDEGCPVPPPAWCPSGTQVEITANGGFETAEVFQLFPVLGDGWGYEQASQPVRQSSVVWNGSHAVRLEGSGTSNPYFWDQLQFLFQPSAFGLAAGDGIHIEMALRSTGGFTRELQVIDHNNPSTSVFGTVGAVSYTAPAGTWGTNSIDKTVVNVPSTARIALHFGGLAVGQYVYVDDFHVWACP